MAAMLVLLAVPDKAGAIVYWGNASNGQYDFGAHEFGVWVSRASMDGGNVDPYFVRTGLRTNHLDAQGGYLFWAYGCTPPPRDKLAEQNCEPPGLIGRAGVDGSDLRDPFIAPLRDSEVIGGDSTHVYWIHWVGTVKYIGRARLDGTEVDHQWFNADDALDDSFLGVQTDLEVDGDYIYVASQYQLSRIALDRSSYQTIFVAFNDQCCAHGIAVDSSYIYFTWDPLGGGTPTIGRVKKDGTELDKEWLKGPYRAFDVEVNSTHIYWSDTGAIGRARVDVSEVQPELITMPPGVTDFRPAGLALDETPTAPVPPSRPDPTATGVGGGGNNDPGA